MRQPVVQLLYLCLKQISAPAGYGAEGGQTVVFSLMLHQKGIYRGGSVPEGDASVVRILEHALGVKVSVQVKSTAAAEKNTEEGYEPRNVVYGYGYQRTVLFGEGKYSLVAKDGVHSAVVAYDYALALGGGTGGVHYYYRVLSVTAVGRHAAGFKPGKTVIVYAVFRKYHRGIWGSGNIFVKPA